MCIVDGKRRTGFAWFLFILIQQYNYRLLITPFYVLCIFYISILQHDALRVQFTTSIGITKLGTMLISKTIKSSYPI